MGFIIGAALGVIWIALGLGTHWFGLPAPWSMVIAGLVGFLCTFAFGPAIANLAERR